MNFKRNIMAVAIAGMSGALTVPVSHAQDELPLAPPYQSPVHVFSINDLQTDLIGSTYNGAGTGLDPEAICGLDASPVCPEGVEPFYDKQNVRLYPVDTAFGFHVVDFLGAQEKSTEETPRDYLEGFVGNITDGTDVIGVKISNSETAKYKVKPPMGTWCQGLGGTSVKCSTEHYTVMEHVLSCNEVVPYHFADPDSFPPLGEQADLSFPDGTGSLDCATAALDDILPIVGENGLVPAGTELTSVIPDEQMYANDNTTVQQDIAVSGDYSVTLKDDGKPLYRWGGLIKRPNDIRFYARIPLPPQWKNPEAEYKISSAKLVVSHWITNNPNDQLRPEDLENEAATGRTPSYKLVGEDWQSTKDCYEGDGDFIDSEDGNIDPTPIGSGTVLKNAAFANVAPVEGRPQNFSSDLVGGFTNGYYTTIDRDPFEWSYVAGGATDVFDYVGSPLPLTPTEMMDQGLELVSGPRWRLKANKFGQDIPGLEIPLIECSAPPFGHDNIKYEVGAPVTTVINLLDWETEVSPLATSRGWTDLPRDGLGEPLVECQDLGDDSVCVTSNGLPMSDDFDLAVYVKGDRKPTALYSAQLIINEFEEDVPPFLTDASIQQFKVPTKAFTGDEDTISLKILVGDNAQAVGSGDYIITGTDGTVIEGTFDNIAPGKSDRFTHDWTAPDVAQTVDWTVQILSAGVELDSSAGTTEVRAKK